MLLRLRIISPERAYARSGESVRRKQGERLTPLDKPYYNISRYGDGFRKQSISEMEVG